LDFRAYCKVDLQLASSSVKNHSEQAKRFLIWLGDRTASIELLREYLSSFEAKSPATYANVLKSLKVLCRDFLGKPDLVSSFRFPNIPVEPKEIPDKKSLQQFLNEIVTTKERSLFLLYAASGLRRREILGLDVNDVDLEDRMIRPKPHEGRTKHTWVGFFNNEAAVTLKEYLSSRQDKSSKLFPMSTKNERQMWRGATTKTGLSITPQVLRKWFCEEMGRLGVQDRYIDAFCGRVPKSVLARHYSDYAPDKLKEIYDSADLKVLS